MTNRAHRRAIELHDRAQELIQSDAKWKETAESLQEQLETFTDGILEDEVLNISQFVSLRAVSESITLISINRPLNGF
jgi:hypothetical protein